MRKKILVIEDEKDDFDKIKKFLVDSGYAVLPDNFEEMSKALDPYSSDDIEEFVIRQIEDNILELGLIISDIKLNNDKSGGVKVVLRIRAHKYMNPLFFYMIPIFAMTRFADRQQGILSVGADYSIVKDRIFEETIDKDVINQIIFTQINKFERNLELLHVFKNNEKVFIVHGHGNTEDTVARFLSDHKLKPIILHEQVNEGTTIIEKIEKYSDVGYAIILYTSCDVGMLNEEPNKKEDLKPRARQNVVFEHGFMTAKLGRENVCILLENGVEKPGDTEGMLYVPFDTQGAWKEVLKEELINRGLRFE